MRNIALNPWCKVRLSTTQSVPTASTTVAFDEVIDDAEGMLTSAGVITIPMDGVYAGGTCLAFAANSTGTYRAVSFRIDDSYAVDADRRAVLPVEHWFTVAKLEQAFVAGQTIRVRTQHDATSNLTIARADHYSAYFSLMRKRPLL